MEINNKIIALSSIGLFVAGGLAVYFTVPTKIKTKIEVREKIVEKKITQKLTGKTRIETKKETLPNGNTVETEIVENDGSIVTDSNEVTKETEKIDSKVIINPKNLHLGLVFKFNPELLPELDLNTFSYTEALKYVGVQVSYDLGVYNTFITASFFGDKTIIIGAGLSL